MSRVRLLSCLLVSTAAALTAQAPADSVSWPGRVAVQTGTVAQLRSWDSTIDRMVRDRQMVVLDSRPDPDLSGHRHETLAQYYQGIPVFGATMTRQTAQGATVSIIGNVFENISVDTNPALSADEASVRLAAASGAQPIGASPQLVIFPTIGGAYRLAYRMTMSDVKTYIVDAETGSTLATNEESRTQSQVGVGTGVLGDQKKMSTTQAAGAFRAFDQLRPAAIRTFDTRGSDATLNRLLQGGAGLDSDFSVDADNTWADAAVVDTHVHAGWTEDYFFKQHGWTAIDNRRGTITAAVHSTLLNNAFFAPPPFGADGRGMVAFGRTTGGVPMTALDVVAHELMHGVTDASVRQRTGAGLFDGFFIDRFGPTTVTSGGTSLPCDSTFVVFSDGSRLPLFCNAGRYVLLSNYPGAINEAFSDVFGIATEFFHHPAGTGPLRADYKMGEDLIGFGPNRAPDAPASLNATSSTIGNLPYPDHASRAFAFVVAVTQGTRTSPLAILVLPWTIQGTQLVILPSTDNGGVHWNSTILSHAFYLAIEGGRNATSGLTVQGVGAANRLQIERAFFRAMTVMMPNTPSMNVAAQAVVQSAIDLYGANSAAAVATRQAMQAVGLVN